MRQVTLSSASPVRYQIYLIYPTYVLVLAVSRQDFGTCVINAFLCLLKLKEKEGNPSTWYPASLGGPYIIGISSLEEDGERKFGRYFAPYDAVGASDDGHR